MRIAFFTSHLTKSLQWYWYCEALKNEGVFHVHVVINHSKPLLVDELNDIGIPAFYFEHKNIFSHVKNLFKAIRILRKYKINLLHTSLPYGNLIGQLAGVLTGIKARVTTCENASWAHDFGHKKQFFVDKLTFFLSKRIIATADSPFEYLSEYWKLPQKKLAKIYHGLKVDEFDSISAERISNLKEKYRVNENDIVIGMIARLEFWKGHKYAIEAINNLKNDFENIKLLIFGASGSAEKEIFELIAEFGLEDNVKFMGFTDDPIAIYQLFDIHLHVPIDKYVETGGINIIEGMISRRPQILTKSGYAFQSADHLENSVVVDYKSSEEITKAITLLLDSPDLRNKISENAYQCALEQYSNEVKLQKHLKLYREVI